MAKILLTSEELVFQWNEDITDEPGVIPSPNGDRTYVRQYAVMEAFPGVTPEDVVEEYLKFLQLYTVRLMVDKSQIGMSTIGFENNSFRVCFSLMKFEEMIKQFLMPTLTDPAILILDKEHLAKVVYAGFFQERDRKIATETRNKVKDLVSKFKRMSVV